MDFLGFRVRHRSAFPPTEQIDAMKKAASVVLTAFVFAELAVAGGAAEFRVLRNEDGLARLSFTCSSPRVTKIGRASCRERVSLCV